MKTAFRISFLILTGVTSYCIGVYAAIEANHGGTMNVLIKIISIAKRLVTE